MSEIQLFLERIAESIGRSKRDVDPFIKMYTFNNQRININRLEENWYMTITALKFLRKDDFDKLNFPSGLRDIIMSELGTSTRFSFVVYRKIVKITPICEDLAKLHIISEQESCKVKSHEIIFQSNIQYLSILT